jgi:hypothetical protein
MRTPPDDTPGGVTGALIDRVQHRLALQHVVEAAIAAALMCAGATAAARMAGWRAFPVALATGIAAAALMGTWVASRATSRSTRAAADLLERHTPGSRNLIVTAQELLEHRHRGAAWMRTRVLSDADRLVHGQRAAAVVPLRGRGAALAAAAATFIALLAAPSSVVRLLPSPLTPDVPARGRQGAEISIVLRPPAHTKLPAQTLIDPERITAVEGTVARVSIDRDPSAAVVRFVKTRLPLRRDPYSSATVAELTLTVSGYLAMEGEDRPPRLIPVAVIPDRIPDVRVENPGRDLLVPAADRTVPIRAVATDDFGLALMSLRYTRVSGSGEQYEFVEGEVPLEMLRTDARSWQASGSLPLDRLGLERGDSLVYRVVARDGRPGDGGFSSSDTFFIEVAGPGQVALEGFEMPPERERYALSQQMIVLKIERLRAREQRLSQQDLREEAAAIAGEQRAVKGNFVFLTGGHVEDEAEEAEASHEIQEGRLENTAHREITTAIAHMTRVEEWLAALDTRAALAQAKLAVGALQRAFGRNRYLLRTLPVRSRVDPSRRLTGSLDDASGSTRSVPPSAADSQARAMDELLATMLAAHRHVTTGRTSVGPNSGQELVERALAIDAASPEWQTIASHLAKFANASGNAAASREAVQHLEAALSALVSRVRAAPRRQIVPLSPPDPLRGAWAAKSGGR